MDPNQQYQQPYQPQPNGYGYGQQMPQSSPQPGYTPIPPAPQQQMFRKPSKIWVILAIFFIITTIASVGAGAWAYFQYVDQRDNVDTKISAAVATAVKTQADKDAADFLEKEKQPNRQFAGPDDYGRLSFDYPKTWSVYEEKDASSGGTYEAYFNPGVVPPISSTQQYALHVTIEDKDYDKAVSAYESVIKRGDLVSSSVKIGDENYTRLDGSFTKDIKGFAVIFKIRDKTVTIRSDAETFRPEFDALIQTITFND